jgi:ABC-type lipoprotein release transport system permease subunit
MSFKNPGGSFSSTLTLETKPAGRVIQKLLYGIQVVDLPVILMVTGLFLISAAAAAFLPARRAASVDPMDALRSG